jgi:predicted dehydrogenase
MSLIDEVERAGVSGLFAWHSRFAPGVTNAKAWLQGKALKQVRVEWKEQVRKWHPGQDQCVVHRHRSAARQVVRPVCRTERAEQLSVADCRIHANAFG